MSEITKADDFSLYNPLWTFAVDLYEQGNNQSLLLELQDKGYQVNIILSLLWLSHQGLAINEQAMNDLISLSLQSIIKPLRAIRKQVKNDENVNNFYKNFLALELSLEQKEIAIYYYQLKQIKLKTHTHLLLQRNLQCYCQLHCQLQNTGSFDDFSPLIKAVVV